MESFGQTKTILYLERKKKCALDKKGFGKYGNSPEQKELTRIYGN